MKPIICFIIEVYEREIDTRLFCAAYMAKRGWRSIVCHQSDPIIDRLRGAFIVRSNGLGRKHDWHPSNFICAHNEEAMITFSEDITARRLKSRNGNGDQLLLTWGHMDDAISSRARNVKTKICGSPKFDVMRSLQDRQPNFPPIIKINSRFPSLFGTNLGSLESYIMHMGKAGAISNQDEEIMAREVFENDLKIANELRRLVELLSVRSEVLVEVRAHPVEERWRVEKFFCEGTKASLERSCSLVESIGEAALVVHDGCTTGLEAKAAGRPVVALRPKLVGASYNDFANDFADLLLEDANLAAEAIAGHFSDQKSGIENRNINDRIAGRVANWTGRTFCETLADIAETWASGALKSSSRIQNKNYLDLLCGIRRSIRKSDLDALFSQRVIQKRLETILTETSQNFGVDSPGAKQISSRAVVITK